METEIYLKGTTTLLLRVTGTLPRLNNGDKVVITGKEYTISSFELEVDGDAFTVRYEADKVEAK